MPPQGKSKRKKLCAPNSAPKKEHHQRITYLYKVGTIMATELALGGDSDPHSLDTLSRSYIRTMDLVAKKSVSKVHPNIKRVTCKNCSRLMVPGVTAKWRLMNYSKNKMPKCDILEISCVCGNVKRFPIGQKPDYVLFSERDDVLFDPGKGPADNEESKGDQSK